MKKKHILFALLLASNSVLAQNAEKTQDFSVSTPFVEPIETKKSVLLADQKSWISISKTKHNQNNYSGEYVLERYNTDLQKIWSGALSVSASEEYLEFWPQQENVHLFSMTHDRKQKMASLKGYTYSASTGVLEKTIVLDSVQVGNWRDTANKATVIETINTQLAGYARPRFAVLHDYQYEFSYSPNQEKILFWIYDYSQKQLRVRFTVFDKKLKKLSEGTLPLEELHTYYGLYINNKGDVFLPATHKTSGAMVVHGYNPVTRAFSKLSVPFSQYFRADLKINFLSDNELILTHTLLNDQEKLTGLGVVKLDYAQKQIQNFGATMLSDEFRYYADSLRSASKLASGKEENWRNFHIVNVQKTAQGGTIVLLEKREFFESNYAYTGLQARQKVEADKPETKLQIRTESVWAVAFDSQNNFLWQQYIPKSQSTSAGDGLQSISFASHFQANSIKLIYASSKVAGAPLFNINPLEISMIDGKVKNQKMLDNTDKISLLRHYTLFLPDGKLILAGRKGLLSSSSLLLRYPKTN